MTAHDGPGEPGALTITWREVDTPDLLEARLIVGTGNGVYVGYVARSPGDDEWRGHIGLTHALIGIGTREAMQAAVEQAAREAWAARQERAAQDQGQRDTAYRSDR